MTPTERRLAFVRRLALLCAVLVLAVTSLSAFLRQTQAGLGCPAWPACYGQALRQAQLGIEAGADKQTARAAARLAHRAAASLALLLVITMLMACFGARPLLPREGRLALGLLGLALLLAVLGFWSRAARLPAVAMSNLLGGFLMFALCVRLAGARAAAWPAWLRAWSLVAAALMLLQVALGSLVSASYAGLSCSGWGGCELAEAWRAGDWGSLNPWREPTLNEAPPFNPAGALPHSLHRQAGLLLGALLLPLVVLLWRHGRRRRAALLGLLLLVQVMLGLAMTALTLPLGLALLHNLLAASLLATLLTLV